MTDNDGITEFKRIAHSSQIDKPLISAASKTKKNKHLNHHFLVIFYLPYNLLWNCTLYMAQSFAQRSDRGFQQRFLVWPQNLHLLLRIGVFLLCCIFLTYAWAGKILRKYACRRFLVTMTKEIFKINRKKWWFKSLKEINRTKMPAVFFFKNWYLNNFWTGCDDDVWFLRKCLA